MCPECGGPLPESNQKNRKYCSRKCKTMAGIHRRMDSLRNTYAPDTSPNVNRLEHHDNHGVVVMAIPNRVTKWASWRR